MEMEAVLCIAACEIVNFWYGGYVWACEYVLWELMSELDMNMEFF